MNNKHLEIREAIQEDLPILQEFEQGVIQYERPFAANLKKDPISYYDLEDLIQRKDALVLVAMIQNKIIAESRGISEIQLDVYAANDSAIKAYEKFGFQPDLLKMRLNRLD